ncbi:MAG: Uncharacterised protein [Opitutia bacterium UBA7350]|nr:MAG: Uncharacterised protein [Opitutae bacterium UBA7350]
MPEFEETDPASNAENYTPSKDAKPRSRRRSGGFKKELAAAPSGAIGEIDPAEALRGERLSGSPAPNPETQSEPKPGKPARVEAIKSKSAPEADENMPDPQPTEKTLAAIKAVEARILERKAKRDARHQTRKKERAKTSDSASKRNTSNQSSGLIASILKFFGLGPKPKTQKSRGRRNPRSSQQNRGSRNGNRRRGHSRNPRGSSRRD